MGFASIIKPLTVLLKNESTFVSESTQEQAFTEIKAKLISESALKLYNAEANHTELHTDDSSLGLGAMLLQADKDKPLHLMYAISRSTAKTKAKHHSSN